MGMEDPIDNRADDRYSSDMEISMTEQKAFAVTYATRHGERLTMVTADSTEEALAAVMAPGVLYASITGEC